MDDERLSSVFSALDKALAEANVEDTEPDVELIIENWRKGDVAVAQLSYRDMTPMSEPDVRDLILTDDGDVDALTVEESVNAMKRQLRDITPPTDEEIEEMDRIMAERAGRR